MTAERWNAAIKPKVQGSWNLHSLLPPDLSFFVMLSSLGGILGNRAQSNYAAGCTYQDALARYRVSQGLKGTSLDLGMILGAGFVAENYKVMRNLQSQGYVGVQIEELHAMLEVVCNPNYVCEKPEDAQIITGVSTPRYLKQNGVIDEPFWMGKPLFSALQNIQPTASHAAAEASAAKTDYAALVKSAASDSEAGKIVADGLAEKLARVLSVSAREIDLSKPLHMVGVDSLIAVEVRNWIAKEVGVYVAVFKIMEDASVLMLSEEIAKLAREGETKG